MTGEHRGGDGRRSGRSHDRGRPARRRGPPPFDPSDPFRGRRAVAEDETDFSSLGLAELLLKGVAQSGYMTFTDFQKDALPLLLEGKSVIARAGDSSGRTVAFLVPLIQRLTDRPGPRVLVMAPTRMLASQIHNEIRRLSHYLERTSALLDAGARIAAQADALGEDPHFVVGTPGRILDHIRRENVDLRELDALVLIGVDRMVDQRQGVDVEDIVAKVHKVDQVIQVASAFAPAVLRFCRRNVGEAVDLFDPAEPRPIDSVQHSMVKIPAGSRMRALLKLIRSERPDRAVIFCSAKEPAEDIADRLDSSSGGAEAFHAAMAQRRRGQILERFNAGGFSILVATDAVASELEAEKVAFAVNFDIPEESGDYVFRMGRIADSGTECRAVTLAEDRDAAALERIEEELGKSMEEMELQGLDEGPVPEGERAGRGRGDRGARRSDERSARRGDDRGVRRSDERSVRRSDERSVRRSDERSVRRDDDRGEEHRGRRDDERGGQDDESNKNTPSESAPAWLTLSKGKASDSDAEDKQVSNERLFHGGWKKQRKRR